MLGKPQTAVPMADATPSPSKVRCKPGSLIKSCPIIFERTLWSLICSSRAQTATGTKNKELSLIDGATHIQTYCKPEYVEQVVNKLKEFYAKYL